MQVGLCMICPLVLRLHLSRVSRVFVVTLIRVDTRDTLEPNHSWQFVVKNSPRITCITSIRSNSYPCRYERYARAKSFVATGDLTPLSNHPLHENREGILLPPCASYQQFVGTECASNLPL